MTETETTSRTRSRLLKGGGAVLGVAAIGAAVTLTASNWTDTAEVQGEVSTGEFTITIGPDELTFGEFNPSNADQTSSHTLENQSTSPATITLEESPELPAFNVEVVRPGDPETEQDPVVLSEGESFQVDVGGSAEIDINLTLTETEENPEVSEDVQFVFQGEQVVTE